MSSRLLNSFLNVMRMDVYQHCEQCTVPLILFFWLLLAIVLLLVNAHVSGKLRKWRNYLTNGYVLVNPVPPIAEAKPNHPQQRTFSYPDTLTVNYFDPDNLPDMTAHAAQVHIIAQKLFTELGFQVDNCRNQAEHVLMLLVNANHTSIDAAIEDLHKSIFKNYCNWCRRLNVVPNFTVSEDGSHILKGLLEDVLLYLLVWGEAGNLRHMPESICFIYHKTMEERMRNRRRPKEDLYPGFFLDMVITPIYEVVAAGVKGKGDHDTHLIYDDFNEFFWTNSCLRYSHKSIIHEDNVWPNMEAGTRRSSSQQISVAVALQNAKKTYFEKRSWLHPLNSFHRVFEWHVITFTLLLIVAFANSLLWNTSVSLKIASFIFIEINTMSIIWICLEIWTLYPGSTLSGPAICGYILRLSATYVILIYQAVYYHWAFCENPAESESMRSFGDNNFWWWQYVWLSLFALALYLAEAILCWTPQLASVLYSVDNDVLQAVLNICYPFTQLYVGKSIHIRQSDVLKYITFWVTLLSFKLWFGYYFVVRPITVPVQQLYDDYMNYKNVSLLRTILLMILWVLPHFMVYIIDLSIWYSVWSSFVGGFAALLQRQGAVRNTRNMRSHFVNLPLAFERQLMPTLDVTMMTLKQSVSRAVSVGIPAKDVQGVASSMSRAQGHNCIPKPLNEQFAEPDSSRSTATNDDWYNITSSTTTILKKDDHHRRWIVFARAWNDIISRLRDIDQLSNLEKDILSFTYFDWLSKPVYMPLYQTAGCIEAIVYEMHNLELLFNTEADKIKRNSFAKSFPKSLDLCTREAVFEAWELSQFILSVLLGRVHEQELRVISGVINDWFRVGDIFDNLSFEQLPKFVDSVGNLANILKGAVNGRSMKPVITDELRKSHGSEIQPAVVPARGSLKKSISTGFLPALTESTDDTSEDKQHASDDMNGSRRYSSGYSTQPFRHTYVIEDTLRDKLRDEVRNILSFIKSGMKRKGNDMTRETKLVVDSVSIILSSEAGFLWNDLYSSSQVDLITQDCRMSGVFSKLVGLVRLRQAEVEPSSTEAKRRLYFFVNSLFMEMPRVPSTFWCKEFSCLTPFYSEDVLLTKADLEQKNNDGVSTLLYLQTLFKKDWMNFLERRGITDDQVSIWSSKHIMETRMWASLRAQTLFRTVEGMMYSEAAIRLIAELEEIEQSKIDVLAKLKFNYVIACQQYSTMKKSGDHKAQDIDFLLSRHPNLRVAYIDSLRTTTKGDDLAYYSVLIKHDETAKGKVREVYRVKLPGNPIVGEGKPENQNHALIFTRGRYLQAVDMNQDGYFEEALKMRNLLEEFTENNYKILGFREHIFTGSVSSVANYMALQELSFVTLGQRVLHDPLKIRQHYGHPDLFDKLFVMTEGGMSKASHGINLSEDVFAGFNATIRGHDIGFREYVQVGKGRDVGLQQTYKFEAKLAQGNAEQSLSRDMDRICSRLDFFRLMSFYYGGIGHYMANTLIIFTLVLVVYIMAFESLYDEEGINGRPLLPLGTLQLLLAGMGILQTLPLCATLTVEKGFFPMIREIAYMLLSGGPFYFIFHIQTKAYYFQQTILAGGAMYRPTGRGFVIRRSPFDENYRFFATSHLYLGIELTACLLIYLLYTESEQYLGITFSLWLVVVALVFGPFWFNPLSFETTKVAEDYGTWKLWMSETGGRAEQSWSTWWKEENAFYRKLSLTWKMILLGQKCLLWCVIAYGLAGTKFVHSHREQRRFGEVVAIVLIYLLITWLLKRNEQKIPYALRRIFTMMQNFAASIALLYLFVQHVQYIRYAIALYYLCSAATFTMLLLDLNDVVMPLYQIHDYLVGHVIFVILMLLSLLQFGYLQTWLLYHNAVNAGVMIEDVLKFARKSKERAAEEADSTMADLRAHIREQDKKIQHLTSLVESKASTATEKSLLSPRTRSTGNLPNSPRIDTSLHQHGVIKSYGAV